MLRNIGMTELLVILAVVLLIFGPQKLPEMGKAFGRALREFRSATRDLSEELDRSQDERPAGK